MPRGKHGNHVRGVAHPRYRGGRTVSSHGYIKLYVGKDHHLSDPNGYAYEHQLEAEKMLGRPLVAGETVHHRSQDKSDNRPENLQVLLRADHGRHHASERPRDGFGRLTDKKLPAPVRDDRGRYVAGVQG